MAWDSAVGIMTLRAGQSTNRIPGGGLDFCTWSNWPWGIPSLLYNGYLVFPRGKRLERGIDHPSHLAARLKKE